MHDPFWQSATVLLRYKRTLSAALIGALVSAACFGAGIGMILPALHLLLKERRSIAEMISEQLVNPDRSPWVQDMGRWLVAVVPADPFAAFVMVLAIIGVLAMIGSTGRYFHELLTITVVQRAAMSWRGRMFSKLIYTPYIELLKPGASDYISRVAFDTRPLVRAYQALLGQAVEQILKGAAALLVAIYLDWVLTMIALLGAPPLAILLRKFGKRIRRATRRALRQRGRMIGALKETMGGVAVVKIHNAEAYERRRFSQINRQLFAEEMKIRSVRALASPLVDTLGLLGVIVVASIAAWYIFSQGLQTERFMAVLVALGLAAGSLKPLAKLNNKLNEGRAAAQRLFELLALPGEPTGPDAPGNATRLARHHQSIIFDNVTFTYPSKTEPAIRQLSLRAEHGQTIAIVGGNGSGKTTLLSLLPRLLLCHQGHILIDGQDIAKVQLRSLRRQLAVVTQQTVLFEGTITNNIAYGRRYESREKIIAASQAAFAHEFISALDDGYDTMLGEDGSGLSGGQRQRLAIARAILRDPAILILDEATSQIDAESEVKISRALRAFRRGRTVFAIAHRLSTVMDADRIVVLDAGRLIDQGTHDELLHRCAIYQTLTHAQRDKPQ